MIVFQVSYAVLLWASAKPECRARALQILQNAGDFGPALGALAFFESQTADGCSPRVMAMFERAIAAKHTPSLRRYDNFPDRT
jgi:hypothetical protein